jgi:hypothetical protein
VPGRVLARRGSSPGPTLSRTASSTASPAVRKISGIVHLEGAMQTSGTNPLAFTLPVGFRPTHYVYVPVDMDLANRGTC